MNVLKCHRSQRMGLRRDLRYSDIYCEYYCLQIVHWCKVSFIPSLCHHLSFLPSILNAPSPTTTWKHQSIPCCIDYCTLGLWMDSHHSSHMHRHRIVCQHQSIFQFHNIERRGKKNKRRGRDKNTEGIKDGFQHIFTLICEKLYSLLVASESSSLLSWLPRSISCLLKCINMTHVKGLKVEGTWILWGLEFIQWMGIKGAAASIMEVIVNEVSDCDKNCRLTPISCKKIT